MPMTMTELENLLSATQTELANQRAENAKSYALSNDLALELSKLRDEYATTMEAYHRQARIHGDDAERLRAQRWHETANAALAFVTSSQAESAEKALKEAEEIANMRHGPLCHRPCDYSCAGCNGVKKP
jgi:hypothetical protein